MPFNSPTHRRVRRALAVALAAAAVTAPAVTARPVQTPDARDAGTVARQPRDFAEQIRGASSASNPREVVIAPAVDSVTRPSLPGPPTWPVNPVLFHQLSAAAQTEGTDGVDWTTIGLGIAGSLFAIGGLALLSARRTQRLRVTA